MDPKTDRKPITIEFRATRSSSRVRIPTPSTSSWESPGASRAPPPIENLFKTLKLKNVLAEDAAKTISEIFNGPQQSQQPGRGWAGWALRRRRRIARRAPGRWSPLDPGRHEPKSCSRGRRADQQLAVVVKATPIDLLTIEKPALHLHRCRRHRRLRLDQALGHSGRQRRRGRNRDQVKDAIQVCDGHGNTGGNRGGFPVPIRPAAATGQRATGLVCDRRTTAVISLILLCSEGMKKDSRTLVARSTRDPRATTEVVQLVPTQGNRPRTSSSRPSTPSRASLRNNPAARGGGGGGSGGGGLPGGFGGGWPRRARRRRLRWWRLPRRMGRRRVASRRLWAVEVTAVEEAAEGGGGEPAEAGRTPGPQAPNSGMEGPLNFNYLGKDAPSRGRRFRQDRDDLRPDARRRRFDEELHRPYPAPPRRRDPGRRATARRMPPPTPPGMIQPSPARRRGRARAARHRHGHSDPRPRLTVYPHDQRRGPATHSGPHRDPQGDQ